MSITRVFLFLTLLTYTLGLYLPDKEVSALADSEVDPSMNSEEEGLRVLMAREARLPPLTSSEEQRQNAAKATTEPPLPYEGNKWIGK